MISEDKKQYNDFAEKYSNFQKDENRYARNAFYEAFDFPLTGKLLDAGCGDGQDINYYARQGAEVYGFDSSDEMVRIAQQNNLESKIQVSSFESTPYNDDFFDIILSKYAIQHSKNIEPVFDEFYRILKKNGILCVLVTHPITHFLHQQNKDYFKQSEICLPLFDEKVTVCEPSHQLCEYFSKSILKNFTLEWVKEGEDLAIKNMLGNAPYPGFLILKMIKK